MEMTGRATRTARLLVRLTEEEHVRLRLVSQQRGHPMGRILRDAFASESAPDYRLPVLATLSAVEEIRLFLEHFFPKGEETIREVRGPALEAALRRLDELSAEIGARR